MKKLLKNARSKLTIEEQALSQCLPDVLPYNEIPKLIAPEKYEAYKEIITKAIFDREIIPFKPNWSPETERLNITFYGIKALTPHIHKNEFKKWLEVNGEWPLNSDCLLVNWWADEESGQSQNTKKSKNQMRNEDFKKWLDEYKPDLDKMKKSEIHEQLMERKPELWVSGFPGWWKEQDICKKKPGRTPG